MTTYASEPKLLELLEFSLSLSSPEKLRILERMKSPSPSLVNIIEYERMEFARLSKKSPEEAATVAKLRARAAAEWIEIKNKIK